jgi:hydroxyquinol 1,2-dioxygenase
MNGYASGRHLAFRQRQQRLAADLMGEYMREFTEDTITEAVLDSVAGTPNPRVREISDALIRHLHAFIKEAAPTESEWKAGIDFLTKTGRMCTDARQEFILLSDTLGVSMLVDAINHRLPGSATQTTVLGPFHTDAPFFNNGADIRGHHTGPPMYIAGSVKSNTGEPICGATVDVWHSDHQGFYDLQKMHEGLGIAGRGRFLTDARGRFNLWTIRPCSYPIPDDGPVGKMLSAQGRHPYRPEHIHFMIQASGYAKLITHLFAENDRYLDSDVVFGVKASLIRPYQERNGGVAPDGRPMCGQWFELQHDFELAKALG